MGYSLKVSEKTDVYNFGVVLLELVISRSPIDTRFDEGKDIVYYLSGKLTTESLDGILDPRVVAPSNKGKEDMLNVLRITMLCTVKLSTVRLTMRDVVKMLTDANLGPAARAGHRRHGAAARTNPC
ncbi:receptor-like protein kinase 7 [Lolium perenne]|uniref:receptor-like protein kinase 7 n=1 Tax=Lolium perenne TaxID=4522 RepID=UPI003A99F60D